MGQTMSGQRHTLTETDVIRVDNSGDEPVLQIGEQRYVLPADPQKFERVKSSFKTAWQDLDSIDL